MQSYPPFFLRRPALAVLAVVLTPFSALGQDSSPLTDSVEVIEVFTTAGTPMTRVPPGTAVIELDAPARLDAELSRDLPADPAQASAMMRERMQPPEVTTPSSAMANCTPAGPECWASRRGRECRQLGHRSPIRLACP